MIRLVTSYRKNLYDEKQVTHTNTQHEPVKYALYILGDTHTSKIIIRFYLIQSHPITQVRRHDPACDQLPQNYISQQHVISITITLYISSFLTFSNFPLQVRGHDPAGDQLPQRFAHRDAPAPGAAARDGGLL